VVVDVDATGGVGVDRIKHILRRALRVILPEQPPGAPPWGRRLAPHLPWLLVAAVATAPAWIVVYPPLQDLPVHLATMRVIHSYGDPAWGFSGDLVLALGRTQYLLYYLAGSLLAYVTGVFVANVILMCVYPAGTVLALRALLRALGKDERLCLFVVPFLPNELFMTGLFPFLLGITLMLWGLALAVRWHEEPAPRRGVLLALIAVALFATHMIPLALFGLGFALLFPWGAPRRWPRAALPVLPVLLVAAAWLPSTAAGRLILASVTKSGQDNITPPNEAIETFNDWFLDSYRDVSDEIVLIALLALVMLSTGLSQGEADGAKRAARRYALLPLACFVLYFAATEGHDYLWLFSQRFPVLCFVTAIPLLRFPPGWRWRGAAVTALALVVSAGSLGNTCRQFIAFQRGEVGDFEGALGAIPPGRRVAALMFDRDSAVTNNTPFLHFGSYYQLRKGGVVEFSYAGYAHWPVDFKPGKSPPPGGAARPRWEWEPEEISVEKELYPYFDYILQRGGDFFPPTNRYRVAWEGQRWRVWKRVEK